MKNKELRFCPFCGGEADWCDSVGDTHEDGSQCHLIVCKSCGVSVDAADTSNPETFEELKACCAKLWNARVDTHEPTGE